MEKGERVAVVKSMIKSKVEHLNEVEKALEWKNSGDARTAHDFFPEWKNFRIMRKGPGDRAFWRILAGKPTLRYFLEKCWKRIDDPICSCKKEVEDVHHFVLRCEKYDHLRKEWTNEMKSSLAWFTRCDENLCLLYDYVCATKRFQ